jgi:membrane associated rhomboid family serine protease
MLEEFKNAFHRYNNAHVQLIIINVSVFVVMAILTVISEWTGGWFNLIHAQFAIPSDFAVFITKPWTILTYAFVHSLSGILHILFNMLALYWFGRLFVEYLGSDKLIALYVLGALAGAVLFLIAFNVIPNPPPFLAGSRPMVGASAAIFAVMVGIATLIPDYTFFLLLIGPVKIKYIAAVYIFLSFLGSVGDNAGGDIAHLGGALMGFIYTKQLQAGVNWGSWVTTTIQYFRDIFKPKPKVKVSYRNESPSSQQKKKSGKPSVSQAELDAILDKISAGGYESLTKDEKEKLFNASKKN